MIRVKTRVLNIPNSLSVRTLTTQKRCEVGGSKMATYYVRICNPPLIIIIKLTKSFEKQRTTYLKIHYNRVCLSLCKVQVLKDDDLSEI